MPEGARQGRSLVTKLADAIAKKCDVADRRRSPSSSARPARASNRKPHSARRSACPPLDSVGAVSECLIRHHRCRAGSSLERELPRLDELLTQGGVDFP